MDSPPPHPSPPWPHGLGAEALCVRERQGRVLSARTWAELDARQPEPAAAAAPRCPDPRMGEGRVELPPRAEGPLSWRWREASDLVLPITQAEGRGETGLGSSRSVHLSCSWAQCPTRLLALTFAVSSRHASGSQPSAAGSYRTPRGPGLCSGGSGDCRATSGTWRRPRAWSQLCRSPCGPERPAWLRPCSHGPPGEPSRGDACKAPAFTWPPSLERPWVEDAGSPGWWKG